MKTLNFSFKIKFLRVIIIQLLQHKIPSVRIRKIDNLRRLKFFKEMKLFLFNNFVRCYDTIKFEIMKTIMTVDQPALDEFSR